MLSFSYSLRWNNRVASCSGGWCSYIYSWYSWRVPTPLCSPNVWRGEYKDKHILSFPVNTLVIKNIPLYVFLTYQHYLCTAILNKIFFLYLCNLVTQTRTCFTHCKNWYIVVFSTGSGVVVAEKDYRLETYCKIRVWNSSFFDFLSELSMEVYYLFLRMQEESIFFYSARRTSWDPKNIEECRIYQKL